MLPLPLAPLLTPMPGCCAWLVSIEGCEGCEVEPLAPPETPTPVEAGGVATDPPPVMPVDPPTPPPEVPAPTDAPPPAEPDVWAWAIETAETAQTRAMAKVFIIWISSEGWSWFNTPGRRQVAWPVGDPSLA
jgi:hypothetical protein